MKMNLLFGFFTTFLFFLSNAQSSENIIVLLKKRDVESVIKNCTLPFDLRVGSGEDDEKIIAKALLSKKLKRLFHENYFDDIWSWKRNKKSHLQISYSEKTFDKNGELESESKLTFYFKKLNNHKIVLYSIIMAG